MTCRPPATSRSVGSGEPIGPRALRHAAARSCSPRSPSGPRPAGFPKALAAGPYGQLVVSIAPTPTAAGIALDGASACPPSERRDEYVEAAGLRLSAMGSARGSSAQGSGATAPLRQEVARPSSSVRSDLGSIWWTPPSLRPRAPERIVGRPYADRRDDVFVATSPSHLPFDPVVSNRAHGSARRLGVERSTLPGALAQPGGAGQGHHEGTRCAPARDWSATSGSPTSRATKMAEAEDDRQGLGDGRSYGSATACSCTCEPTRARTAQGTADRHPPVCRAENWRPRRCGPVLALERSECPQVALTGTNRVGPVQLGKGRSPDAEAPGTAVRPVRDDRVERAGWEQLGGDEHVRHADRRWPCPRCAPSARSEASACPPD